MGGGGGVLMEEKKREARWKGGKEGREGMIPLKGEVMKRTENKKKMMVWEGGEVGNRI